MIKTVETRDSLGNLLNDSDTVTISRTLKWGDKIKNIRTICNPQNIECRIGNKRFL